jgi:hypothetical protein
MTKWLPFPISSCDNLAISNDIKKIRHDMVANDDDIHFENMQR